MLHKDFSSQLSPVPNPIKSWRVTGVSTQPCFPVAFTGKELHTSSLQFSLLILGAMASLYINIPCRTPAKMQWINQLLEIDIGCKQFVSKSKLASTGIWNCRVWVVDIGGNLNSSVSAASAAYSESQECTGWAAGHIPRNPDRGLCCLLATDSDAELLKGFHSLTYPIIRHKEWHSNKKLHLEAE